LTTGGKRDRQKPKPNRKPRFFLQNLPKPTDSKIFETVTTLNITLVICLNKSSLYLTMLCRHCIYHGSMWPPGKHSCCHPTLWLSNINYPVSVPLSITLIYQCSWRSCDVTQHWVRSLLGRLFDKSRPNKAGVKCPPICACVRTYANRASRWHGQDVWVTWRLCDTVHTVWWYKDSWQWWSIAVDGSQWEVFALGSTLHNGISHSTFQTFTMVAYCLWELRKLVFRCQKSEHSNTVISTKQCYLQYSLLTMCVISSDYQLHC